QTLTVTGNDQVRLYGAANAALTGTITGIKNGENITASYSTAATQSSPIGTYPVVPALNDPVGKLINYIVTLNNGHITINPAPLAVRAADASRPYGIANPALTGSITGLQNGDAITA